MGDLEAVEALLVAFPGSELVDGHHRWLELVEDRLAGSVELTAPAGVAAYAESLPAELVTGLAVAHATGYVWGPCSVCGEGSWVPRPPVPQRPRAKLKSDDGPLCRMRVGCKGRHYPLHGPWRESHPLGDAPPPAELPW